VSHSPTDVSGIVCDVLAQATFRASGPALATLRRSPGTLGGAAVPVSLLRHADEQTVVGLAAVLRAIREGNLDAGAFNDWAVVAAPQHLGHALFFQSAFAQFLAEGAWGVSPHLISNHSLHSPSGAISLALKAQGPNLGVGGAPGCEPEAFVLAATLLDEQSVAGVWVVLTAWEPAQLGGRVERDAGEYVGCAVALVGPGATRANGRLRVQPGQVIFESSQGVGVVRARLADWLDAGAETRDRS